MSTTKSTKEIADLFAVTPKTVRTWMLDGMPVVIEGERGAGNEAQIDLEEAVRWYFESNSDRLALERERTRLASEQADRTALENAERRGEIGVISEMAEYYGQHIDRAQRRLQQIPQTLGQYCDEKQSKVVVSAATRLIDECVRELAADGAAVQGVAAGAVAAKAGTNGQSVGRRVPSPQSGK